MRGEGPAPQPAPPAPPVETPSIVDQRNADMAMMQKPQMQPPPGGSLGDALKNLQKYVQKESFNNQKGQVAGIRPAAVRYQGRRVRPVDPPLHLAGPPQLVRADGGDDR